MKLTAHENIEAPVGFVNAYLTDFEFWERSAMRRGAEVVRLDHMRQPGAGMEWRIGFLYHSKKRSVELKLLKFEPEHALEFDCMAQPAEGILGIELAEMGPHRTRVSVHLEIKPRTMAARLFLQSLKLAKGKVTRRFAIRLAQTSADIEDRYRQETKA
ncbi:SRPBCC family protein [Pseudorhodobacter sp. W20_MBD10_FR17]|uniref:SRPBCC family protein n=1 Tax=Pseudorhodobacter sp. W20_MBD10_FR17 TaxID=3240266 RepID=UPI003F95A98C